MEKLRLDELLVSRGYYANRDAAERAVLAGLVRRGTTTLRKAGELLPKDTELAVAAPKPYVSRGGEKLAGALADFDFVPAGRRCLDVGASTGGFTDCLLRQGAARVTAVDVAYGQFAWSLRQDARVCLYERSNISKLTLADLGGVGFDLIVADISFSPLTRVLGVLAKFAVAGDARCKQADSFLIALVKPQFELPKSLVGNGIVTESTAHEQALDSVLAAAQNSRWQPQGLTFSRLRGQKGNIEFFLLARYATNPRPTTVNIDSKTVVANAHRELCL
jgi:23S rRNA (cytidine1920-2'-O)/16S rRNA (cytidine1409-2'-O)-methyltransferase